MGAWSYLERGGKRAIVFAHRRWGKDDVAMHRAAIAMHERVGTYWHMLPEAAQARKAIWDAIDPHVGKRRIDIAFPPELRSVTRENEMMIRMKIGSTWQVVGSDNYNSLVGSPPIGLVSSEHALARPQAWAYLRPILAENGGWAAFITTPRGKNHAHAMLQGARNDPTWYTEVAPASKTSVFTHEQLEHERAEYRREYGPDHGEALFQQEFMCNFEAASVGAYFTAELNDARNEGRIGEVPWDSERPVFVAFDLGYSDDVAMWFYQVTSAGVPRFIDFHAYNTAGVDYYVEYLRSKPYKYGDTPLWLPHDGKQKTMAANGRSVQQQFGSAGFKSRIVPGLSLQDGIQATRKMLQICEIDEVACAEGLESLAAYRRKWLDDEKCFKDLPVHDWTSHASDAFRYAAVSYRVDLKPITPPPPKWKHGVDVPRPTFDELRAMVSARRERDN